MLKPYFACIGLASVWLVTQPVFAEEESSHQHDAHVHGISELNVVIEEDQLFLELITPAANIIGFEHMPRTAEQQQTLDDAIAVLQTPEQIFSMPSTAGCESTETTIETPLLDEESETEGHDEDAHAEHDHDHDHDHDEHDEEVHSEIHASYTFQCAKLDALNYIDVLLFQRFPATEELNVQLTGPQGQTRRELTPNAERLTL